MRMMLFFPSVKMGMRISTGGLDCLNKTVCEKEALSLGILFKKRVVVKSTMD